MRVVADTARCVGAGQCVMTLPDVFDQSDDDGTVVLLTDTVDAGQVDAVQDAIEMCPSQAISLVEG